MSYNSVVLIDSPRRQMIKEKSENTRESRKNASYGHSKRRTWRIGTRSRDHQSTQESLTKKVQTINLTICRSVHSDETKKKNNNNKTGHNVPTESTRRCLSTNLIPGVLGQCLYAIVLDQTASFLSVYLCLFSCISFQFSRSSTTHPFSVHDEKVMIVSVL